MRRSSQPKLGITQKKITAQYIGPNGTGRCWRDPWRLATEEATISSLAQDTIFKAGTIASILLGVFRQVVAVQLRFGTAG